jgi:hypothetical protein
MGTLIERQKASAARHRFGGAMYGFIEPQPWPDDGGARREPVICVETKRVVRRVGWQRCLSPISARAPHTFFSFDIRKVRTCDACKRSVEIARSNLGDDN